MNFLFAIAKTKQYNITEGNIARVTVFILRKFDYAAEADSNTNNEGIHV